MARRKRKSKMPDDFEKMMSVYFSKVHPEYVWSVKKGEVKILGKVR